MQRFACFVNPCFYRTAVSDVPEISANYLISLTVLSGRRTIASTSNDGKGFLLIRRRLF